MEKDRKSRVFYHHDNPHRVLECYPNGPKGLWDDSSYTTGSEAKDTYERADFYCVYVSWTDDDGKHQQRWSVHPRGKDQSHWFELQYSDSYLPLVEQLEKRTHKTGLTIIVY